RGSRDHDSTVREYATFSRNDRPAFTVLAVASNSRAPAAGHFAGAGESESASDLASARKRSRGSAHAAGHAQSAAYLGARRDARLDRLDLPSQSVPQAAPHLDGTGRNGS